MLALMVEELRIMPKKEGMSGNPFYLSQSKGAPNSWHVWRVMASAWVHSDELGEC